MTQYGIRSRHTGEWFRHIIKTTGEMIYTANPEHAARYDFETTARLAALRWFGMSAEHIGQSFDFVPLPLSHMQNDAPRRTLGPMYRVETQIRRLSPETLAECRRVAGGLSQ